MSVYDVYVFVIKCENGRFVCRYIIFKVRYMYFDKRD